MSKKEIYIVYDDEKASANLKENGNLVKTVTVKKDVDRNRAVSYTHLDVYKRQRSNYSKWKRLFYSRRFSPYKKNG